MLATINLTEGKKDRIKGECRETVVLMVKQSKILKAYKVAIFNFTFPMGSLISKIQLFQEPPALEVSFFHVSFNPVNVQFPEGMLENMR